ncbi:MAG: TIGR00295 family protein [Methanosphaera sp.]|nr:TIGR00295 family protein [Methanosphaera sp.]
MSPTDKLIENVYQELECTDYIIDHCKVVYERSKDITKHYKNIDQDLIKAGCMLHDVGRTITNNIEHAYLGADLLRNLNIDERICLITERHIGAGITREEAKQLGLPDRNYIPETLEEKIVAHADNLVHGITKVDLDFVINKWNNKNMKQESINMLINLHQELLGDTL